MSALKALLIAAFLGGLYFAHAESGGQGQGGGQGNGQGQGGGQGNGQGGGWGQGGRSGEDEPPFLGTVTIVPTALPADFNDAPGSSTVQNYLAQWMGRVNVTFGSGATATVQRVFPVTRRNSRVAFIAFAKAKDASVVGQQRLKIDVDNMPSCTADFTGGRPCLEMSAILRKTGSSTSPTIVEQWYLQQPPDTYYDIDLESEFTPVAMYVVNNPTNTDQTVARNQIEARLKIADRSQNFQLERDTVLRFSRTPSCGMTVSGLVGSNFSVHCNSVGSCTPPVVMPLRSATTYVASAYPLEGELEVKSVEWQASGGVTPPDNANGQWPAPNAGEIVNLTATLTFANNATCVTKGAFQVMGREKEVPFGTTMSCGYYEEALQYYLCATVNDKGECNPYGTPGNTPPQITYPNLFYDAPEGKAVVKRSGMPFGAINWIGRRKDTLEIPVGPNGEVSVPANPAVREYAGAVVSVIPLTQSGTNPKPSHYAVIRSTADLTSGKLPFYPTGAVPEPTDPRTPVIFRVHLARSIKSANGQELRGVVNPIWLFTEGDDLVPLVERSCFPGGQGLPPNGERQFGPEMKATAACLSSRPYDYIEFVNGLAMVLAMRAMPVTAHDHFNPLYLRTLSADSACVAMPDEPRKACIEIAQKPPTPAATATGSSGCWEDRTESITVPYTTCTWVSTGCGGGYSVCSTGSQTIYYVKRYYTGNCLITRFKNCQGMMGLRFAIRESSRIAAAFCFHKYHNRSSNPVPNLEGVAIAPSLKGFGVLPHSTAVGGAAPALSYPDTLLPVDPMTGEKSMVGAIPCRFGQSAEADTPPFLVSVGQNETARAVFNLYTGSTPISCYNKFINPASKASVLVFGGQCTGFPDASEACGSSNVPASASNIPGGSDTINGVPVTWGTNTFASGPIPLCPGTTGTQGSYFVSASPILVDTAGRGIQVSRTAGEAIRFDMRGRGEKALTDWPVNTSEVAFLAIPENGKVTSVKQLFGTYKTKNGFEALAKLDSNKDGVIDEKDRAFGKLHLWYDRNRNGVVDPGELVPIRKAGVTKLSLAYVRAHHEGIEALTLSSVYFHKPSSSFRNFEDHWFYQYSSLAAGNASAGTKRKKGS